MFRKLGCRLTNLVLLVAPAEFHILISHFPRQTLLASRPSHNKHQKQYRSSRALRSSLLEVRENMVLAGRNLGPDASWPEEWSALTGQPHTLQRRIFIHDRDTTCQFRAPEDGTDRTRSR